MFPRADFRRVFPPSPRSLPRAATTSAGAFAFALALVLVLGLAVGWYGSRGTAAVAAPVAAPAPFSSVAGEGIAASGAKPAQAALPAQNQSPVVPFAALPIVNFQGEDDVCRGWASVANVGMVPTRGILVAWGTVTTCAGQCPRPLGVECTGLIKPGGAWQVLGAQIPTNTVSGMVFSFGDKRLAEIAPELGVDDQAADYLCERLHEELSSCAAYALFKAAADAGGEFAGVPLAAAAGAPLAVTLLRHCPGDRWPGVEVSSSYDGVASGNGFQRGSGGMYLSHAAPVVANGVGTPSVRNRSITHLYLQNAGSRCALVEVWLQGWADACAAPEMCRMVEMAAGTTVRLPLKDCVPDGWQGSAWVRSPDPVALVVETAVEDVQQAFTGVPGGGAVGDITGSPGVTASATEAFAPLVEDPAGGWTSSVVVQNLGQTAGRARVTFLDGGGGLLARLEGDLCPQGSRAFALPASGYGAADVVGSARVESLPVRSGGTPAPVSAVLSALRRPAAEGAPIAGYAYGLLPAALSIATSAPSSGPGPGGPGGTAGGVGVIAVPAAMTDLDGTGVTAELAVQNLVTVNGETEVAVLLYDRNDVVATFCRTLAAREVAYIDLGAVGLTHPGSLDSAVVSATTWRHPAPDGGNLLGLAAVVVQRSGTNRGQDVPGDEVAVTTGFPLRRPPASPARAADDCPAPDLPPPPAAAAAPGTPASGILFLPVLDYQGQDEVCRTVIDVHNGSGEPGKVVLMVYGEPGFCPPQCAGGKRVFCSGMLAPGASWSLDSRLWAPEGFIVAGVLYGFNDRTLADLGVAGGGDTLAADWLCAGGLPTDDCDLARRLHLAYAGGGTFEGVPLSEAFAGPFTATVERTCPDIEKPGVEVVSSYVALSGTHYDPTLPAAGGYWQSAVPAFADHEDRNTLVYLQNTGLSCTGVTVAFQTLGECSERRVCNVFILAPGETYQFDASDCVGPAWAGTLYLRSEAPLAIVAENIAPSVVRSWSAEPIWSPYDLNGDGLVDEADVAAMAAAEGATPGDANWNPRADLDHNAVVDGLDRLLLERGGLCRDVPAPTSTPTTPAGTPTSEPTTALATPTGTPPVVDPTATTRPIVRQVFLPLAVTPGR